MNESDIVVGTTLTRFEEVIEDHSTYLKELENLIAIQRMDYERVIRVLKRMRKVRRDLGQGLFTITTRFNEIKDDKIKEEALGIVSYLNIVGLKDEKEILINLKELARKSGYNLDIEDDIKQIESIISIISKISL
ncbi:MULTISPECIES: hypothetical protein [Acidianus]|uniref:Uncharacterized protein n=1 Tax=Candidatus Acidianus copahuensis TaxID=1160895 RepID=A0A031LK10_9CREN|nr:MULTISPECIES: hypothetical protein [Acidianus]EZQ03138.1 hypothetical protein CM19_09930 [Candidatus Acidianus copahuensis]NON62201.1 hypothetical protein [Acidianus sp. RZ1]